MADSSQCINVLNLLTLIYDHLTSNTYHCVLLYEINFPTKSEVLVAAHY